MLLYWTVCSSYANLVTSFLFLFSLSVKILEKRHIIREKKDKYVMREREVLSKLDHPFFVRLAFTFQDSEKLCILLQMSLKWCHPIM